MKRLLSLIPLIGLLASCASPSVSAPHPQATGVATIAVEAAATDSGSSPCDLEKLNGIADWQGGAGSLVGFVSLTNYGSTACTLTGRPQIGLVDSGGQSFTVQTVAAGKDAPRLTLEPRQTVSAGFRWSNWCGPAPLGGLSLDVTVAGSPGRLLIPVQDPNGQPRSDVPRCDANSDVSTLAIEEFSPGER